MTAASSAAAAAAAAIAAAYRQHFFDFHPSPRSYLRTFYAATQLHTRAAYIDQPVRTCVCLSVHDDLRGSHVIGMK